MTTEREQIEYPDEAGYPDGTGYLDEGTAEGAQAPSLEDVAEFAMTDEEDDEPNL
ncbi:hypothetical protein ACFVWR_10565 [Leifsonia sp. NPDC058292]|uniref:hypothetical protein n=1 Tax=Leifsonia sp. NPDC058292 TaxID=3346428 RepID=UPI0036D7E24A